MRRVVLRLVKSLLPFELSRALGVITCAASANALIAFEQQLNHLVGGASVGAQILQFVPLLAAMSTGESNTGSIAAQLAAALISGALFAIVASFHGPEPAAMKAHA